MEFLLNDYATSFDVELVLRQKTPKPPNNASPELAKLAGIRFAYTPELPAGREWDVAILKQLTGGDNIGARQLFKQSFVFTPAFKLILSGQDFPNVENPNDPGFSRRFYPVEFTQSFTGDRVDKTLESKLRAPAELAGILNLLVREAADWVKNGLLTSPAMQATKEEYITDNDFINEFISDYCELGAGYSVSRKDFLTALKRAYTQAYRFNDRKLSEMICNAADISYNKGGKNKTYQFFGVQLIDDSDE